jgi:hypothetical protein
LPTFQRLGGIQAWVIDDTALLSGQEVVEVDGRTVFTA